MNVTVEIQCGMAVPEDEEALVALWWDMQSSHRAFESAWYADKGEEFSTASWRARFRRLLQDENALIVVARASGVPVGMIVAQIGERPPIYEIGRVLGIAATVVRSDCRNQGVFKRMFAVLGEEAKERGVTVVKLSVHHKNENAVNAYTKTGFAPETTSMIKWLE